MYIHVLVNAIHGHSYNIIIMCGGWPPPRKTDKNAAYFGRKFVLNGRANVLLPPTNQPTNINLATITHSLCDTDPPTAPTSSVNSSEKEYILYGLVLDWTGRMYGRRWTRHRLSECCVVHVTTIFPTDVIVGCVCLCAYHFAIIRLNVEMTAIRALWNVVELSVEENYVLLPLLFGCVAAEKPDYSVA